MDSSSTKSKTEPTPWFQTDAYKEQTECRKKHYSSVAENYTLPAEIQKLFERKKAERLFPTTQTVSIRFPLNFCAQKDVLSSKETIQQFFKPYTTPAFPPIMNKQAGKLAKRKRQTNWEKAVKFVKFAHATHKKAEPKVDSIVVLPNTEKKSEESK